MLWILFTTWTIGLCVAGYRLHVRSTANGVIAVMTATDMHHAMAERARAVELYDIIQRYVYLPKREGKPS